MGRQARPLREITDPHCTNFPVTTYGKLPL
jgi:hypothetical protein